MVVPPIFTQNFGNDTEPRQRHQLQHPVSLKHRHLLPYHPHLEDKALK